MDRARVHLHGNDRGEQLLCQMVAASGNVGVPLCCGAHLAANRLTGRFVGSRHPLARATGSCGDVLGERVYAHIEFELPYFVVVNGASAVWMATVFHGHPVFAAELDSHRLDSTGAQSGIYVQHPIHQCTLHRPARTHRVSRGRSVVVDLRGRVSGGGGHQHDYHHYASKTLVQSVGMMSW